LGASKLISMKRILTFSLLFFCAIVKGQIPEDAIRYSWYPQNATARILAVGGAMGSLGGDISATFVNPAGLAFYHVSEALFSLGYLENNNKSIYRDSSSTSSNGSLPLGPMGFIFCEKNNKKSASNYAFSLAFNQKAAFGSFTRYSALNNYSSFSEQFAEEYSGSGLSINEALNSNTPYPYTSAPALYTYLIDTTRVNNNLFVMGAPENILNAGQALRQDYSKRTHGGLYELALGFGGTQDSKILYGATLAIPLIAYSSSTIFKETDTSSNAFNKFKSAQFQDDFKTTGSGLDLKAGVIYRPSEFIRVGLAIHTPSILFLKDTRTTYCSTVLESDSGTIESFDVSSTTFTNGIAGESKYRQSTPLKAILSASYVFREVEDVTKQRAFLTADIEYVANGGNRFHSDNEAPTVEEENYYKSLNKVIKDLYRSTINFRFGGEIKYHTVMGRLGFAYYGSPYEDKTFRANKMLLSGGIGYRDKGFFIDLTYVHNISKDANFPYRLSDRANTFATTRDNRNTFAVTFGVKIP